LKWSDVDTALREELANDYENNTLDLYVKAEELEFSSPNNLGRRIREYMQYRREMGSALAEKLIMPELNTPEYVDYEVVDCNDAVVISDLEIPDVDPVMLETALLTAVAQSVRTLVIAGDLVATDQQSLNAWKELHALDTDLGYETAINVTRRILHRFGEWFENIYLIEGNHDRRINKQTKGQVHLGMLLRGTPIKHSRYSYMYLRTDERGYVKILHPDNYAAVSVGLGQQLYDVEAGPDPDNPHKAHIVLAHTHQLQSGWSKDGDKEIHALGCMRSPRRTKYKQVSSNKHHQWIQGFLLMKGGYFQNLSRKGTNWSEVLRGYADGSLIMNP